MTIRDIILLAASLVVIAAAAGSQPSGLPPVPAGLSAQQTAALTKERARVVAEGERLQKLVEDHHAKCAHIGLPLPSGQTPSPQDEALKQQCEGEQVTISAHVKQYAADASSYRKAVNAGHMQSATAKGAYAARVVLKGGVQLGKPGHEQSLISSRVVALTSGERVATAAHARAAFELSDGREFVVGAQTDLLLAAMVNDPQPSRRRVDLALKTGTLRWVGGASAPSGSASIALSSGIVRLGACDLQASASSDGTGYVATFKGDATFEDTKKRRTVSLRGQEIVNFDGSGVLGQPSPLKPGQVKAL